MRQSLAARLARAWFDVGYAREVGATMGLCRARGLGCFERAIALAPGNAQLLADRADLLVLLQDRRSAGEPTRLIEQALKIDPDNLKALFRPVVMVTPDLGMICENMLMSEGFAKARLLAKKMTVLYKLAKEQLSKQYHYDFGLRALKSVLVMAGGLKRESPEFDESTILMRALRDMNMPKFIFADVPLFRGLIGDLFPGLDCPRVRYASFNDAVEAAITNDGLQMLEVQVDKVIQLYETLLTRHTTMVVGPTGGGNGKLSAQFDPRPRNFACAETIKDVPAGPLFWVIRFGSPGASMPPHKDFSDEQIWELVLHVRHLAR